MSSYEILQKAADSNTHDNTHTKVQFRTIVPGSLQRPKEYQIALCQIHRERDFVLRDWGDTERPDGPKINSDPQLEKNYESKLDSLLGKLQESSIDIAFLPELCIPKSKILDSRDGPVIVAGQLGETTDSPKSEMDSAQAYLLKVLARRIEALVRRKKADEPESTKRAFKSFLAKASSLSQLAESGSFLQNFQNVWAGPSPLQLPKNVLSVSELLATSNILPGAEYTIMKSAFGNLLMLTGGDFLNKTPYYQGEFNLLIKLLKLLNLRVYSPFYRTEMKTLAGLYYDEINVPIVSVIARETAPDHYFAQFKELFNSKIGARLAFFVNGYSDTGPIGHTSLYYLSGHAQKDAIDNLPSTLESREYWISQPPMRELSFTRISIKNDSTEGFIKANIRQADSEPMIESIEFEAL